MKLLSEQVNISSKEWKPQLKSFPVIDDEKALCVLYAFTHLAYAQSCLEKLFYELFSW